MFWGIECMYHVFPSILRSYYTLGPTVDGYEILHESIDGKHPITYRISTILLVVQDFETIHSIFRQKLQDGASQL